MTKKYIIAFLTEDLEQFEPIKADKYVCFEVTEDNNSNILKKMYVDLIDKLTEKL